MNYLTVIGKTGRNWVAIFPDFPGAIIVTASSENALEKKLDVALGAHLEAIGNTPAPRAKRLKDVDEDLLEGMKSVKTALITPAHINPISLEVANLIESSGLTQSEIARRMGTSQSALSRLARPDYDAHSVPVLERLAGATGKRLRVTFE
jgi:antitoxin HicB